mmetsp:Transcript_28128/g.71705  ORF Transcript_28128/g.71705 Transcript_28128/m.71705 type:complete len:220 (+) Transcript_28128:885-1544(+)
MWMPAGSRDSIASWMAFFTLCVCVGHTSTRQRSLPITSSDLYPVSFAAALFQSVTIPSASILNRRFFVAVRFSSSQLLLISPASLSSAVFFSSSSVFWSVARRSKFLRLSTLDSNSSTSFVLFSTTASAFLSVSLILRRYRRMESLRWRKNQRIRPRTQSKRTPLSAHCTCACLTSSTIAISHTPISSNARSTSSSPLRKRAHFSPLLDFFFLSAAMMS